MANTFDLQILNDGPTNAIVRLTGFLDSGDASFNPAISLDSFINQDPSGTFYGLRLDKVDNQIGDGLQVIVEWAATSPLLMIALSGRHTTCFKKSSGIVPNKQAVGYTGNINIRTLGYNLFQVPPQTFTLSFWFSKLYSV